MSARMRSAAVSRAAPCAASSQRATKTSVSREPFGKERLDAKASQRPSGENIGKPSKPGAVVIRSRCVPSTSTIQRSNSPLLGSWPKLELKITFLPDGWKNGAKEAASSQVS
jgi:hypothetical protein